MVQCYCHHLHSHIKFCENLLVEDNFNNTFIVNIFFRI